jgi:hypothetical protein
MDPAYGYSLGGLFKLFGANLLLARAYLQLGDSMMLW